MLTATCFNCEESTSGYPQNHTSDISSTSAHFGIPKGLQWQVLVKLLQ